jgi:hypothetical protein
MGEPADLRTVLVDGPVFGIGSRAKVGWGAVLGHGIESLTSSCRQGGMPLRIFAMMDSVMTHPSAVRCDKSRTVVFDTRRVGALTMADPVLTGKSN